MRVTSIELAGSPALQTRDWQGPPRAIARLSRKIDDDHIEVTILKPDGEKKHRIPARTMVARNIRERVEEHDPLWAMAEELQLTLDGHVGTNSMVHDYYRELERLAD